MPRFRSERGSGLLSSVIGVGVIVALVGFAANVALGLWIRSTVDSVAYDAARRVATSGAALRSEESTREAEQEAVDRARRLLGPYGNKVTMTFEWTGDPEVTALRVRAPGTSLMPRMFAGATIVGELDRTIVIRTESR